MYLMFINLISVVLSLSKKAECIHANTTHTNVSDELMLLQNPLTDRIKHGE